MPGNKYINKLEGQSVLIIGGTSGIGYGVAEAAIEHGAASVTVSSSSADKIAKTIASLEASYPSAKGKVHGAACNLGGSDAPEQISALMSKFNDHSLDHVIYTAGDGLMIQPLADWTLATMQQAGMVRFFGPLLVSQHLKRVLKPATTSSFIITSGAVADKPSPNWVVINSYAAGHFGMVRGLALDLAPIRVNLVSPGAVETQLWDPIRKAGQFEAAVKSFVEMGVTGELGQVEDVAEAYVYLMKDRNVTGTFVNTSSGALLK